MSMWNERVDLEVASRVLRSALAEGHLDPETRAAVFHDLARVRARIAELRERFPASALHAVAIKANPLVEVLRAAVEAGAGLEAASIEEVHLALAAGCPPEKVVYDSPAKTEAEIADALSLGVHLNADNLVEIDRIAAIRSTVPTKSAIGVRINPLVGGGTIAATSVAVRGSKFGVSIDAEADDLMRAFARHAWLTGLHVHAGSQGCSVDMLVAAAAKAAALLGEVNRHLGEPRVTTLDLGGGLPARYREEDRPPTLAEYVTALRAAAPAIFAPPIRLMTELGRAIHATAGWAASRVEYVKRAGGDRLAVIHLGADFLLRRAYLPDVWHHDFAVFDAEGRPKQGPPEPVNIVGPLCFAGDVLARGAMLPAIAPGDFVIVRDVGAYTLGMWSRHCSRGLPLVLGHDGDRISVLKARETPADVVRFWSRGG
jgi:diaminopimelate decarboxylase